MKSAGSIALERTGKTHEEVGRLIEVSSISAHNWRTGKKKPNATAREKLHKILGIDPKSWDEPPTKAARGKLVALPTPPRRPDDDDASVVGGPFAMARELERQVQSLLRELDGGLDDGEIPVSPLERAKIMASAATTLDKLTKITGQHDLGRRVLQLPMFKRAVEEMVQALKPFPGAAEAVAKRMDQLERDVLRTG